MLDSANFNQGTVNFTKSVTVLAVPGAVGSIVAVNGAPAATIASASVNVTLRNVVIGTNVLSPGVVGINLTAAHSLTLENSTVQDLQYGIDAQGTSAAINVTHSVFRNIIAGRAIRVSNGPALNIMHSQFVRTPGIEISAVTAATNAVISDSTIASNDTAQEAIFVNVSGPVSAKVGVTRSTLTGAGWGISATCGGGSMAVAISYSTITHNNVGMRQAGTCGVVESLGNNDIENNGTDVDGALYPVSLR